jgi:hypothetical protein
MKVQSCLIIQNNNIPRPKSHLDLNFVLLKIIQKKIYNNKTTNDFKRFSTFTLINTKSIKKGQLDVRYY